MIFQSAGANWNFQSPSNMKNIWGKNKGNHCSIHFSYWFRVPENPISDNWNQTESELNTNWTMIFIYFPPTNVFHFDSYWKFQRTCTLRNHQLLKKIWRKKEENHCSSYVQPIALWTPKPEFRVPDPTLH